MSRLLAVIFFTLAMFAQAQELQYPIKPIRFIVGYAPGGATDIFARSIARKMEETLSQTIIVENKAWAGSNSASEFVAHSAHDGYNLLLGTVANATNINIF
jgi:tripartite-type tricarboxylate transporter receptor subunit TctC